MSMVNCPGCNEKADTKGITCPKCGTILEISFMNIFSKNIPTWKRLQLIGTALMYIGCGLVLLELFEIIQTYVGSILIGLGFLMYGYSVLTKEKEKDGKRRALIMIALGAVFFIAGVIFVVA
jgi:NADH:ubiquinone oxidoreductase subunit 6 (subunit J)